MSCKLCFDACTRRRRFNRRRMVSLENLMKLKLAIAGALMAATASAGAANAGCVGGAVVGGVAGHFAGHHPLLGAAAGCVVGHHMSVVKHRRERAMRRGY